jgi:hypothetical protein
MTFLVSGPEANNMLLWVNIGTFNCLKYTTDQLVKTTFNNVVLQGDKMNFKALNDGLIVVVEPGVEFLSVGTFT